ncbi:MAG TPA: sialate O-acetylesterase [Humisphaera sp.]
MAAGIGLFGGYASASGEVRLARVFSDHLVLQRDAAARVWGTAAAGEAVTVTFGDARATATADGAGNWEVRLPPMPASAEPRALTATGASGGRAAAARDVLVGDVWLCSGQSNMAFSLGSCDADADVRSADLPAVRFLSYWEQFAAEPAADLPAGVAWRPLSPGTAAGCSAVGFYFARRVHREVGVPIGLLTCTVGGTEIECWLPPEAVDGRYPDCAAAGRRLREAVDRYRKSLPAALDATERWIPAARRALADGTPVPPMPRLPQHPNVDRAEWVRTTSLFNGMVHPLTRFAVKGVLWYQGENNGGEQDEYVGKQRALVETWRARWGQDFPFYYVQLPNYQPATDDPAGGPRGWGYCRMAQLKALSVPKTGMAVTIDVGDARDIHPKNKQDVGERLALWALAKDYGKRDLVFSGPLLAGVKVEGDRVRVSFDHVGGGLMVGRKQGRGPVVEEKDGRLRRFAVAGADKVWHWADAAIDGPGVVVSSPAVPKPVAVRYAFASNPEGCNLYNRDGLPASPFRTDDW